MPGQVTADDVLRMQGALYIDPPVTGRSSTRFWTLLVLAGVIATAGLIADSAATVIGAMIVAPLMTPILGTALAVVLADREHLLRSVLLVLLGALAVIGIGYLLGMLASPLDAYASNGQVQARVHPRLIDLVAALATGTVGAFALVRSDISDALPGVAIAISLVPPLAVVGLLLEVQQWSGAFGAALLFTTNFAAIVATGTAVLLVFRIREVAERAAIPVGHLRGRTLAVVAAGVGLVAVPLAGGSLSVALDQQLRAEATPIAEAWARTNGWQVATVNVTGGTVTIQALGPPPEAKAEELRAAFDAAGLADVDVAVQLVVGGARFCPAGATTCSIPTAGTL
ncbi:MAG: DUF389 domain-containing protein [Candidatus Nanopelagicales bacterium]|jgi:uncharacterized hydrophobic protein (TIGR00271 family)|nr:DUF389 domain-containing protein [Candidatus Nanopelagicales bacterium]